MMTTRQLNVDFELHADNDLGFKNELIALMIRNLQELKQALDLSLQLIDMSHYKKACHKVSSTMCLLSDNEFNQIVEEIKVNSAELNIDRFNKIQSQLVRSLELETRR